MPPARTSRPRGHLGRGALYSLLLHAALVAPICVLAFVWGGREEAQRTEEVDVGFESVADAQLPPDLPALEPPKDESALEKLKPEAKKPPPKKKPEKTPLAQKDEPKPEPEIVVPPMPPMPAPPPPPPPEKHENMKSVDVDHSNDQVAPDAKFLA